MINIATETKNNQDYDSDHSSNLPLQVNDNQTIFFSIKKITDQDDNDYFAIDMASSDIRPESAVEGQGDHVTAYRCFLEVLINIFNSENIQESIGRISQLFQSLYPENATEFENFYQGLIHNTRIESLPTYEERQEIKNWLTLFSSDENFRQAFENSGLSADNIDIVLRTIKTLSPQKIDHINNGIKGNKQYSFADALERIATHFLLTINRNEETAFTRDRDNTLKNRSSEGSDVRGSINRLKCINDVLLISSVTDSLEKQKNIDKFYELYIKSGARYNHGCYSGDYGFLKGNLAPDRVRKYEANLKKGATGDLEKKLQKTRELISGVLNNISIDDMVSRDIGFLFDFECNRTKKENPAMSDILPKLVARHVLFMFHAFPALQGLLQENKEKIIKIFLRDTVLIKNKWENYINSSVYPDYNNSSEPPEDFLLRKVMDKINMTDYKLLSSVSMVTISQLTIQNSGLPKLGT